jgi:MFS family permease
MGDAQAAGPGSSFGRYWTAATLSSFGSAVTATALPVLVVQVLAATPVEVGVVNAAQFLPYAVLGLIAGAYTDRWRRKPVLVWAGVGRAFSIAVIPVLWVLGVLEIWMVVVSLLCFGSFSVFGFAATQSLLPRLVPRSRLVWANSRLDQSDAAAQTLGPAFGGGLVGLLGAPMAIVIDAVSYLLEASLNAGLRVAEPSPSARVTNLGGEIHEGLRWTYSHRTLGRLAMSTHVWFLANGAATTVLSLLALRYLGFTPLAFGLLLAVFGLTSLIGASAAPRLGVRLGSGRVIVVARVAYPIGWSLVAVAGPSASGDVLLFVALALLGLAAGVENSHEMALRQMLTPDALLGRVNATGRSVNRTMAALGAFLAGAAIAAWDGRVVLAGTVVTFILAAIIAAFSPLRDRPRTP